MYCDVGAALSTCLSHSTWHCHVTMTSINSVILPMMIDEQYLVKQAVPVPLVAQSQDKALSGAEIC